MEFLITGIMALAGVALGGFMANKQHKAQRKHEDKLHRDQLVHEDSVRFHDKRLAAYVDFLNAARDTFAAILIPLPDGGQQLANVQKQLLTATNVIFLIGSGEVVPHVNLLNLLLAGLKTPEDATARDSRYIELHSAVLSAVRDERSCAAAIHRLAEPLCI